MQSPTQRVLVNQYPWMSDTRAINATFTMGQVPIQLYADMTHFPDGGATAFCCPTSASRSYVLQRVRPHAHRQIPVVL